uniref:Capsid protein n=1 Tax=Genomoviridae sp. TaxID=2202565 RepID=A0A8F5MM26_9VIRU|nr:MAG: capsid protein [Genomoviridae sp.]
MAYGRISRRRSYRKRPTGRKSRRTIRRTITRYRKKTRGRKMTRRGVLNISSRKKRDTMLSVTNVAVPQAPISTTLNGGYAELQGALGDYVFLFAATARQKISNASTKSSVSDTASRTASTCYMRGLKERWDISTTSGTPWKWRRIVFTLKGTAAVFADLATEPIVVRDPVNGYLRPITNLLTNRATLESYIFRGTTGIDWNDHMIAPLDNDRVTVLHDSTKLLNAGNERGVTRTNKYWHGFNKNLEYDDDEVGGTETNNSFSTLGKKGLGDVLVADFVSPAQGSLTTDRMFVKVASTLYWHER